LRDALRMCALTAGALGRDPVEVLVCSTGVIGVRCPWSGSPTVSALPRAARAGRAGELAARRS